jgi:hypothetical protein
MPLQHGQGKPPFTIYNVKRQEGSQGVLLEMTWKGTFKGHKLLHTTHESLAH